MTPWHCADCRFVVSSSPEELESCPRCGSHTFQRGDSLLTLKAPVAIEEWSMAEHFRRGLTTTDRRFLRLYRLGW